MSIPKPNIKLSRAGARGRDGRGARRDGAACSGRRQLGHGLARGRQPLARAVQAEVVRRAVALHGLPRCALRPRPRAPAISRCHPAQCKQGWCGALSPSMVSCGAPSRLGPSCQRQWWHCPLLMWSLSLGQGSTIQGAQQNSPPRAGALCAMCWCWGHAQIAGACWAYAVLQSGVLVGSGEH